MRRVVVGLAIAFATLTPTWALANDQQIAQQIIQKLEQQKQAGQLKGFGIDLQVDDGTVFMNGRVTSPEQQSVALGIAQRTPGVKQVVNGLQIAGAEAAKPVAQPEAKSNPLVAGWGSSVKKAFSYGENSPNDSQQVAAQEPVPATKSVMAKPVEAKPIPSYTAPASTGVKTVAVPTTPRIQQSQMVAAQPVAYQPPAPPIPQPQMAPRTLQSQMVASNPAARATMPGHGGPSRPVQTPMPYRQVAYNGQPMGMAPMAYGQNAPMPAHMGGGMGVAPARYDQPNMPGYAWPSYASHPNYAAVTYPKQYSPTAWPYIGPFYPYPQVPLGWRKVTLEWDDGWWMLDFHDQNRAWKPHR